MVNPVLTANRSAEKMTAMKRRFTKTFELLFLSWTVLVFYLVNQIPAFGQASGAVFLQMNNDYFTGSDQYYSSGLEAGVLLPFGKTKKKDLIHKFTLVHDIYTPSSIADSTLRRNDHPYAGILKARYERWSFFQNSGVRLSHNIEAGVLGPKAKAEKLQKWAHTMIGDELPMGWHNQIKSKAIVSYRFAAEKGLYRNRDIFEVVGGAGVTTGSLLNGADVTVKMSVGKLGNYFTSPMKRSQNINFDIFFETSTALHFVNTLYRRPTETGHVVIERNAVNNLRWRYTGGVAIDLPGARVLYSLTKVSAPFEQLPNMNYGSLAFVIFV
jgi:hypothetical protein